MENDANLNPTTESETSECHERFAQDVEYIKNTNTDTVTIQDQPNPGESNDQSNSSIKVTQKPSQSEQSHPNDQNHQTDLTQQDSLDNPIDSETEHQIETTKTSDSDNIDTLSAFSEKTSLCDSDSNTNSKASHDRDPSPERPGSLDLPQPLQFYERGFNTDDSSGPQSVSSSEQSFCQLKGTYTRKGDLVEFVADNLQQKIKNSKDSSSMGSRTSSVNSLSSFTSTSMATSFSGMESRSPSSILQHSPDDIPPIDPLALIELEKQAKVVAGRVDLMMGNLKSNLHKMSAITAGCEDAYKQSVDYTCDSVDSAIKSMYTLMARCEELSKSVTPVYQLANQVKEIKRLLDLFEANMDKRT